MKIVDLKQNSKDWRIWRNKGIGASNAPVIMGVSPWTTPFELWLELTGLCERAPANEFAIAAMRRGTELEPKAREKMEAQLGAAFPAVSAEMDEYEHIRASFDGLNQDRREIIELKCPGQEDLKKAKKGEVPAKYYPQIQQQLMVCGYMKCHYGVWSGKDADEVIIIPVAANAAYQSELLAKLQNFWTRVQMQIAPPVTKDDIAKLQDRVNADLVRLVNAQKALTIALG